MAWLGKVSLGGFPDLAGAVTKLSESVKNIEKNFDSALGLEEKPDSGEASGIWPSASDRKSLFDPVMAFMGQKGEDSSVTEPSEKAESWEHPSAVEHDKHSVEGPSLSASEIVFPSEKENEASESKGEDVGSQDVEITSNTHEERGEGKAEAESNLSQVESGFSIVRKLEPMDSVQSLEQKQDADIETNDYIQSEQSVPANSDDSEQTVNTEPSLSGLDLANDSQRSQEEEGKKTKPFVQEGSSEHVNVLDGNRQVSLEAGTSDSTSDGILKDISSNHLSPVHVPNSFSYGSVPAMTSEPGSHDIDPSMTSVVVDSKDKDFETEGKEQSFNMGINMPDCVDLGAELERVKREMKQMEAALQGAARQAQAKADEITKLMNENEQLKSAIEDVKRKSTEAESEALREEHHQRVTSLERKVYALTRERDTLRREQNKRSDAAALLKEKDEIISQVMAEGEELSKKQAAQESTIRKLRAQIREFEEEKQRLNSKLQVEETKVESIKRDKAATEKLLQETIERNQVEVAAQKEFYTNALNAAREAEALAEAQASNEAKIELESRLREASDRETMLVQALEELRQTLSRTEQQASFREDMLQRDIDDLQKRYQASELRYNELVTQVPESTRPLLRQIEAMQETSARKAEAWDDLEKNLNSRLKTAEANAAASEERERSMNDRLSQTLSRMTVLETQIACLRTEQTQLSRSLEKERQRASESRQEYLAAIEDAATQEGRAKQLEDEIRELRSKHKQEMQEIVARRELIEKELERERAARSELERTAHIESSVVADHSLATKQTSPYAENDNVSIRKLSSAGSISSMEESFFLQASLDSSESGFSDRRVPGETISPYFLKSMTPSAFEATLRQKDGELASYMSRLASLESIRDSLAEELVNLTAQCEKLQAEATVLPGIRAELESLRRRHTSALELMGERDEELEELRADIIDMKEMYREQVDLLVNKIQMLSSVGAG